MVESFDCLSGKPASIFGLLSFHPEIPRYFPPEPPEFGGVDACCCCCCDDIPCDDPKAGAESGRVPALIGVETALAVADCPTLLFPLMPPAAVSSPDTSIVRLFFILLVGMWFSLVHRPPHRALMQHNPGVLPIYFYRFRTNPGMTEPFERKHVERTLSRALSTERKTFRMKFLKSSGVVAASRVRLALGIFCDKWTENTRFVTLY